MLNNQGVDSMRFIAVFFVVLIHSGLFLYADRQEYAVYYALGVQLNQIARFAVPFFFVISGYFWGVKLQSNAKINTLAKQRVTRLFKILFAWNLVYILPYNFFDYLNYGVIETLKSAMGNVYYLVSHPLIILTQGSREHLWFLYSLSICFVVSAIALRFSNMSFLLAISVALFGFGLMGGAYQNTGIGIDIGINTRNGPFFGLIFFVLGMILSQLNNKTRLFKHSGFIFICGVALQSFEMHYLHKYHDADLLQDYVFSTLFIGLSAATFALRQNTLLTKKLISKLGRLSLGVYLVHPIILDYFREIERVFSSYIIWSLVTLTLTFLFSSVITKKLLNNKHVSKYLY